MKMSTEHYRELEAACHRFLPLAENTERMRWDMLWASNFPVNKLYNAGLTDDHIDTALRKIAKGN